MQLGWRRASAAVLSRPACCRTFPCVNLAGPLDCQLNRQLPATSCFITNHALPSASSRTANPLLEPYACNLMACQLPALETCLLAAMEAAADATLALRPAGAATAAAEEGAIAQGSVSARGNGGGAAPARPPCGSRAAKEAGSGPALPAGAWQREHGARLLGSGEEEPLTEAALPGGNDSGDGGDHDDGGQQPKRRHRAVRGAKGGEGPRASAGWAGDGSSGGRKRFHVALPWCQQDIGWFALGPRQGRHARILRGVGCSLCGSRLCV
jgi:hypothetical protein